MAERDRDGARTGGGRRAVSGRQDGSPPAVELSEDATVVRAMYRALGEGDLEALAATVDPDIGWIEPSVSRLPFDGTRRGLSSVLRAAFRQGIDGTGPRVWAGTFLELGDGVLVAGLLLTDANAEGEPFLHECLVKRGRIFLVRGYPTNAG